jgi:hypothetical protein
MKVSALGKTAMWTVSRFSILTNASIAPDADSLHNDAVAETWRFLLFSL